MDRWPSQFVFCKPQSIAEGTVLSQGAYWRAGRIIPHPLPKITRSGAPGWLDKFKTGRDSGRFNLLATRWRPTGRSANDANVLSLSSIKLHAFVTDSRPTALPTIDILPGHATAVFLGTGTSVGVPAIGCECAVCLSDDPLNQRLRCAMLVHLPAGTLLIDTPPDLRTQLLREKTRLVHAVLYTHEHADHLFGLDDMRLFPFRLGHPVPLYCTDEVEQRIRQSFDYAFSTRTQTHPGSRPQLEFQRIDESPFEVLGARVTPIPMKHGPHFDVFGFRIGNFAYCTDTNLIPDASIELLQGVETFVVGALRYKTHPTHYSVDEAVEIASRVGAKQTLLTHICHDLDHRTTSEALPDGIDLAYDGQRVDFRTED